MAHRAGPYTQVYDKWLEEWVRAGLGGTQMAVMIRLCKGLEFTPDGRATARCSRQLLAASLGKSEESIRCQTKRLKALGFLRPVGKARRGTAQVYEIMPSIKWPELRGVKSDHPNERKGGQKRPHRGVKSDPPYKKTRGAPAVPAARPDEPADDVNVQGEAPVWTDDYTIPKWEPPRAY